MMYKIYLVINKLDGKKYVGYTQHSLEARMKDHLKDMRLGSDYYFHNALRKYGINAFQFEVIFDSNNKDYTLNTQETYFIKEHKSHYTENGYNMSWGGEAPFADRHHTEKTKEKMRETHIALQSGDRLPHDRAVGSNNGMYGKEPWNKGKTGIYGIETLQSMADARKHTYKITTPSGETVVTKELKIFSMENGLSYNMMWRVSRGHESHHRGYKVEPT